nr:protein hemingway [Drosophila bipectinata]
MSERGENSDEEYYVNEDFEEDSQSELEEQETEEEGQDGPDDDGDDTEIEVEELVQIQKQSRSAHLEESDTQSESDVEAEFMRGNPHARRVLGGRTSGRGFNRDRMPIYPSSSSDDESQVIVTKTVAEVNHISLQMDSGLDDETPSVRTLKPDSARFPDEDEDDTETEVEEIEEEEDEEVVEDDEDAQSDGTIESNKGHHIAEESDEDQGTDVEVEQLEEDEPVIEAKTMRPETQKQQEDIVSLVDASDNSSEYSVVTMGRAGQESDVTLEDSSPRLKSQNAPSFEPQTPQGKHQEETAPASMPILPPLKQLDEFLYSEDGSLISQPDTATVKYLEHQMAQMSEMIMKTFRMNGGATNSQAFEQLAAATELMQKRGLERDETESEANSITESALTSARSCGGRLRPPMRSRLPRSQEALLSTRSPMAGRPKCRCPSESDLIEHDHEIEMGLKTDPNIDMGMGIGQEDFLMDECGQGDGLMMHPHQRRPPEFHTRAASGTPSTFTTDGGSYPINVTRSRCSNEKINYKNLGRKSFSFTNPQVREIERQNQILLRKMMTVKPTATIKASTSSLKINTNAPEKSQQPPAPRLSSAAVNRKKYQRQIDLDNDILKRKLEAIGTRRPQFK